MMKPTQLPKTCPDCGKAFSRHMRPTRKMRKKALLLFLAGVVFTMMWAAGLAGLAAISPILVVPRHPIGWAIIAVIVFAPGLLIGGWAMKMPKVVRLQCTKCNWSESYVIDNRG